MLDGHNGRACADHCAGRLCAALDGGWEAGAGADGAAAALRAAFPRCTPPSSARPPPTRAPPPSPPSSAACRPRAAAAVAMANAGDYHAVLWRGDGSLLPLARRTPPTTRRSASRRRAANSPHGRGKARVQGRIQVTRCLGDRALQPSD